MAFRDVYRRASSWGRRLAGPSLRSINSPRVSTIWQINPRLCIHFSRVFPSGSPFPPVNCLPLSAIPGGCGEIIAGPSALRLSRSRAKRSRGPPTGSLRRRVAGWNAYSPAPSAAGQTSAQSLKTIPALQNNSAKNPAPPPLTAGALSPTPSRPTTSAAPVRPNFFLPPQTKRTRLVHLAKCRTTPFTTVS